MSMVKQGAKAVVPRLRFLEFRNEPQWETSHLGDVCELYQPETIPSSSFKTDGMHLVYGAGGVIGQLDRFNHEHAEVIIGCRGVCGNASLTEPKSWITGNAMVIRSKSDKLLKPFLFHLLDAADLSPVISGSAQPQITRQGLRRFSISAPAPAEQQKIADCLTSLDEVIAAQGRKVEALKAHKRGLTQQLFPREGETRPRLRFPEFRDAPEWREAALGPLTSKVGSGVTPRGGDANYKANGRPFVRSQNVGWGLLLLDDIAFIDESTHASFLGTEIMKSDVLLNITGASIGRSAVADERIAGGNVNQHVCIIRAKRNELDPVLLNQFLVSERGQEQIDSFQAGGNRQGLNFAQIRSFQIPLPPTRAEQQRIADCLSSLDTQITAESNQLAALKTHKQGLMQQLFPAPAEG